MENNVIISVENVAKSFPGVQALKGVSFKIRRGTTHCIIGENGAGKSTLMKILSGVQTATSGNIVVDGETVVFHNPAEALEFGVGTVYQELSNYQQLDVAHNMYCGMLPIKHGMLDWKKLHADTRKVLDEFGLTHVSPTDMMVSLSLGAQQMIEIAKLLIREARIVILDEPTSALTSVEVERLFELISTLKEKGVTVLFISHKLDEVKYLADDVTVLKDGQHVVTVENTEELTESQMIRYMVGRDVAYDYQAGTSEAGEVLMEVENMCYGGKTVQDFSFKLHRGEVIGISGLEGSGRTELFECIVGWKKKTSGTVKMNGKVCEIRNTTDASRCKIGYMTKERKHLGLFLSMSVQENISAAATERLSKKGIVQYSDRIKNANVFVDKMSIKISGLAQRVMNLSGGNQQKVLLGMWLSNEPDVLLIDEPTRGVDVGAKREIHVLIREAVKQGKGVVLISSEMPELMASCDRILVMHEGKLKGELKLGEYSEEKIMSLAYSNMQQVG
ncbi:MAG: sugar ABC transporter ATP-binding protein [Oscillibacter sp.]|nr:sugar ABC transporter ATP-binding protein [Oscillibacter sp.]